jgi:hypothetical protein
MPNAKKYPRPPLSVHLKDAVDNVAANSSASTKQRRIAHLLSNLLAHLLTLARLLSIRINWTLRSLGHVKRHVSVV